MASRVIGIGDSGETNTDSYQAKQWWVGESFEVICMNETIPLHRYSARVISTLDFGGPSYCRQLQGVI